MPGVPIDVEVVGVKEFLGQLRQLPERADLSIRKRFREIAGDVRDDTRAKAESARPSGGTRQRRRKAQHWKDLVNSIRSGATSESPYVSIGTERVPWAIGWEWGSSRLRQFPRPTKEGRFLWSTTKGREESILEEMGKAIDEAFAEAYPE